MKINARWCTREPRPRSLSSSPAAGGRITDDAGFAAALSVRETVLNDALFRSYNRGGIIRSLKGSLPGGLPEIEVDTFLAPPILECRADGELHLLLRLWGSLRVTMAGSWKRDVDALIGVRLDPRFKVTGTDLELQPKADDVTLISWEFEVTSGGAFPPEVNSYLSSAVYLRRLEEAIRIPVTLGLLKVPPIDISPLGGVAKAADAAVPARVDDGVLMVGFNVSSNSPPIVGNKDQLSDFTRGNDVAAVIKSDALPLLLGDRRKELEEKVTQSGATLVSLNMAPGAGKFQIHAEVKVGPALANVRLALVPTLFAQRAGAYIPFPKRTMVVRGRSWPAFGFSITDVDIDVELEWDHRLLFAAFSPIADVIGGTVYLFAWLQAKEAAESAELTIAAEQEGASVPRVQRSVEPDGTKVRTELAEYAIAATGVSLGLTLESRPPQPMLVGPLSIPANLRTRMLAYSLRLPAGAHLEDPALHIRWTVVDADSGTVLDDQDGPAAGRDFYPLIPESIGPGLNRLKVISRVYRALGAETTDLLNDSILLQVGDPAPAGAYIRWHYEVKNPQIEFDGERWTYADPAQQVVLRRSNLHRTDRPCLNASHRSRYTTKEELLDDLPFDIAEIDTHRSQLCDYCFYGGPGGVRPRL